MGTREHLLCFTLSLVLVSVYCIKDLESLKDLMDKIKQTGEGFPRIEGIMLLCTIYRNSKIDQNEKLHLNEKPKKTIFHSYKNHEGAFPHLENTFMYYSFGNLKEVKGILSECFYSRITKQPKISQNNIDRVVITVRNQNPTLVDEVYITQHYEDKNQGSDYDKEHTYRIGESLFKEINELCKNVEDEYCQEGEDKDKDKDKKKTHSQSRIHESASNSQTSSKRARLKLRSTGSGKVRIMWDGIPAEILKNQMIICVYKDKDEDIPLGEYAINGRARGKIDTDLDFNPGLHVRFQHPIKVYGKSTSPKFKYCRQRMPTGSSMLYHK